MSLVAQNNRMGTVKVALMSRQMTKVFVSQLEVLSSSHRVLFSPLDQIQSLRRCSL